MNHDRLKSLITLAQTPFDAYHASAGSRGPTWIGQHGAYVVKITPKHDVRIEHIGRLWLHGRLSPAVWPDLEEDMLAQGLKRLQQAFSATALQQTKRLYQRLQHHALEHSTSDQHLFYRHPEGFESDTLPFCPTPASTGVFLETRNPLFMTCSWNDVVVRLPSTSHDRLRLLASLRQELLF